MATTFVAVLTATAFAGCLQGDNNAGGEDLQMKMGTMMPLSGALSNLGPDMQKAAHLAIKDVNDAKMGLQITKYDEDDKTTDTAGAPATFNRLVGNGATGIAGPCCSGVTGAVLDLAKQSEVVVSSPSATSPSLTLDRQNDGYFWRVSPSDAVQGKVLSKLVADDGNKLVSMIVVNNAYGNGLAKVFQTAFLASGGVVAPISKYAEGATSFSSNVDEVCAGAGTAPKAIVLVAYTDDGANILKEMQAKDCLSKVKVYGSEGIYSADGALATKAGKDASGKFLAAGVKGTTPEAGDQSAFVNKFKAAYGKSPELYSAESYDAVMYMALAALAAQSTAGKDYKAKMLDIANAPGEKCTEFSKCAQLLKDGKEIDYDGYAHSFEFDQNHEPKTGIYAYWAVKDDGTVELVKKGVTA